MAWHDDIFAGLLLDYLDGLAVELRPAHFDQVAAPLPGVAAEHDGQPQVCWRAGVEGGEDFLGPRLPLVLLPVAMDARHADSRIGLKVEIKMLIGVLPQDRQSADGSVGHRGRMHAVEMIADDLDVA